MLSGLARKLTSLFFEFCVLVISCLCKAWTFQIPFVLVCLWPLDFVSAWLSRSFLFEKCMFTGNVCTRERLSISEYIDTDICFKTAVRSFYHITINNSVLCLIFVVDVIYKPCFFSLQCVMYRADAPEVVRCHTRKYLSRMFALSCRLNSTSSILVIY